MLARLGQARADASSYSSRLRFREQANGHETAVIVAASTVAIVAIAAAVIVVALLAWYVLPEAADASVPLAG
jgi:hypothetical protein